MLKSTFIALPEKDKHFIFDKLRILEKEPRCYGSLKLKGTDSQYRVRKGDYRIIYLIDDKKKFTIITDIANRKDIYKKK